MESQNIELRAVIKFLTKEGAKAKEYVGKPSSAYGWSGGFSPGSPVFAHLQ